MVSVLEYKLINIRGCAAGLSMVLNTFGIVLGFRFKALDVVLDNKIAKTGIDLR